MKCVSTLSLSLIVLCVFALGGEHHAPLPSKILNAKTVYINNETGFEEAMDHCYEALQKWGRYVIVADKSKADLILVLRGGRENRGAYAAPVGNSAVIANLQRSLTSLMVVDASNGDILWSDTQSAPRGSRAGSLIGQLKKRVEEAEKQR